MDPIVVVGSGASGVHFAITALRKGRRVTMLDVGHTGREAVMPGETLSGLKRKLPDPALYFLGPRYESLVLPGNQGEYYAFPPAKEHVFSPSSRVSISRGWLRAALFLCRGRPGRGLDRWMLPLR